jgi:hypothetical protein
VVDSGASRRNARVDVVGQLDLLPAVSTRASSLTPFEESVTCNGVSAALDLGYDGAFRALTELQSRLLAFHQAHIGNR